jgi:type II secretory pathway pseudopilin PulG
MRKVNKKNSGQGLIEMMVAIMVLVSIATGLLVAVTVALKNVEFAKKKAIASICAQEAIEQARIERDSRVWKDDTSDDFYNFVEESGGLWALLEGYDWEAGEPTEPNYQDVFKRRVHFEETGEDLVQVTAICEWTDSSGTHQSQEITYLSKWK